MRQQLFHPHGNYFMWSGKGPEDEDSGHQLTLEDSRSRGNSDTGWLRGARLWLTCFER